MPTIVDALVVQLGLDATEFKRGQKEINSAWQKTKDTSLKHAGEVEESNTKLLGSFNKLKVEAIGFLAALLGAREVKEFVAQVTQANAAIGRLATNLGESPQMLQAWGMAVERIGGRSEDATASITNLAKAFYDAHNNGKSLPQEIYRVYAAANKVPDTTHGLDKFLNDTASALQLVAKQDRTAAFFFGQGMGLSDSMVNLMIQYGDGVSRVVAANKGLGATDEQIKNSQVLIEKWSKLSDTSAAIGRDIENWFSPAFKATLERLQDVFDAIHRYTGYTGPQDLSPAKQELRKSLHLDRWDSGSGKAGAVGSASTGAAKSHGGRAGLFQRLRQGAAPSGSGSSGVPFSATSMTSGTGISQAQYDAYKEGLTDIEGKDYGRMGGKNKRYAGRYQMGPSEIAETAGRLGVPTPTNAQFLADPQTQERFFENYTADHYNQLMKNPTFAGMSVENKLKMLGYAHNQGVGGATNYLRTGVAGRDGWGTSGTAYFDPIGKRLAALGAAGPAGAAGGSGDFVIGDSLGVGVQQADRAPGMATVGMGPKAILDRMAGISREQVAGKRVILSSGASNDPKSVGLLAAQLDALKRLGVDPKNVRILGVGDRGDFAGVNDQIQAIAKSYGAGFVPLGATGPDHVHSSNYKALLQGIPGLGSGLPPAGVPLSHLQTVHPVTTSSTSNAMHVGSIHVNAPQATDATGIASSIHDALGRYGFAMQAQSGQV